MDLKSGQTISHYRLIEEVGAGGMGVVWSAQDTSLKRNVALKILPPVLTADPERRLRFQREAQTAASLSHPNIAVIHEVSEHEGLPFLVMELIQGKTLREVAGGRALPMKEWLRYAVPIADALAHAHKSGIVHRDLKAANVMITGDGHVKLLDFGLAKLLDPDSADAEAEADLHTRLETISRELTRAGKVIGTVAYMSPEQARGEAVDHRSDIFSFGVLLYELVTGRLPFQGNSDIESLNATLTQDPPSLSQVVGPVPGEAERIVTKAMEKEPGRRYQHAEEIVTDFRNLKRDMDTGRVSLPGGPVTGATATATPGAQTMGTGPITAAGGGRRSWLLGLAIVAAVAVSAMVLIPQRSGDESNTTVRERGPASPSAPSPATPASGDAHGPLRIVVLPFENLGDSEDEFFAAGVTEEVIGRLASVGDLSVISRSSAFQYDRAGKSLQQIGADFNVDHVLEGTVRWARSGETSRVRISPQLMRVSDDTSIWGESYDAPMDDIFQVQTDIAQQVIDALGMVLLAPERESLEVKPTENQQAYQAYLQGKDALDREPQTDLAERMFRLAVEQDPAFVLAWAGLSRAQSWRYHAGDRTADHCEAAREAAEEALRLAPDAPEGRMALGLYHYRCFRDYARALEHIEAAGEDRPNDVDVLTWKATLHKRQGNFQEALRLQRLVQELDPMELSAASETGVVQFFLRDYPEAIRAYDRALSIAPDVAQFYVAKAQLQLAWKGSVAEAREMVRTMPSAKNVGWARLIRFYLEYYDGRYEAALALLQTFPEVHEEQDSLHPRAGMAALCHEAMGDAVRARESFESAERLLRSRLQEHPDDFRIHSDLGPILAALGRREEALAAANRAIELMPLSKDHEAAPVPQENLARVQVRLGDLDAAFDQLAFVLETPGRHSIARTRIDPRWRPLVDDPRFPEFARRYEAGAP